MLIPFGDLLRGNWGGCIKAQLVFLCVAEQNRLKKSLLCGLETTKNIYLAVGTLFITPV